MAGRQNQHARRVRYPEAWRKTFFLAVTMLLVCTFRIAQAQESTAEQIVIPATRFGTPLEQSPASVSVIDPHEFEEKQIERVADALRQVPGLSVVQTGPRSTLYGPRALAGAIQLFTKIGDGAPKFTFSAEGGSYGTFREALQSDGKINQFGYSFGFSRLDADNARPNNQYRNTSAIADFGWSPNETLRVSSLFTYSLSDLSDPNSIFSPRPRDYFPTER